MKMCSGENSMTNRWQKRAKTETIIDVNFPNEEDGWPEVGRLPVSLCEERNCQDEQAHICKFDLSQEFVHCVLLVLLFIYPRMSREA